MRRSVTARRGGVEDAAGRPAGGGRQRRRPSPGARRRVEHLLLAPAEQLGQHPVHDDGGQVDVGLVAEAGRSARSSRSPASPRATATITTPVWPGRSRMSSHPLRLVADQPDLHQLVDRLRAPRSWPTMWPVADGVDDDEVVVVLAHLPRQLADGEDLLHARARRWPRSRTSGQRPDAGDERQLAAGGCRYSLSDSSVSIDMAQRFGWTSRALNAGAARPRRSRRGCPWRRPRRRGCACPARRPSSARPAATVVLPTPPLPVTKSSRRSRRSHGRRAAPRRRRTRCGDRRRARRSRRRRSSRPGTPTWRPVGR